VGNVCINDSRLGVIMTKGRVVNFWTWNPILEHGKFIGRPTKWGNPFYIGTDGNREECIAKYEEWIREQPYLMESLDELEDRILVCYCAPKPCHGDVLLKLLEERKDGRPLAVEQITRPKKKLEERKNG
jgi:hypothetical protein